jgi:hypothetical protein
MFSFGRFASSTGRLFSTATSPAPGDGAGFINLALHKDNIRIFLGLLGTAVATGFFLAESRNVSEKVDKVELGLKSLDDKINLKSDNQGRDIKSIERTLVHLLASTRLCGEIIPYPQRLPNKYDVYSCEQSENR